MMSLRPLFGHQLLRTQLASAARTARLPSSLLLTGPRGVGKQRLALWLGQRLLCTDPAAAAETEPCGQCTPCRYALRMQHPDLHWFFPRPKPKDREPSPEDVRADFQAAVEDRVAADGLWEAAAGMDGLYVATTRALVHTASRRPAMAAGSVFVVGDAERMVSQEGSDQAANAFLKLLEEPPSGTTLILTSSEPGALLPTIRSRVITVRVAPLRASEMAEFMADEAVLKRLGGAAATSAASRALAGHGAPGRLLAGDSSAQAAELARQLLDAAAAPDTPAGVALRARTAAQQGVSKARGALSDTLEMLTVLLHARARAHAERGEERHARRVATAISVLENTKPFTQQNVTPFLLTAALLDDLHPLLASPE